MGIDFEMGWVKRDLRSVDAERSSRVLSVTGNIIESQGFVAGMGAMCVIDDPSGGHPEVLAEVVSFDKETIKLIPYHETTGLSRRSRVRFFSESVGLSVSDDLLGRVINPLGEINRLAAGKA
jgi:Flagellar biosynthesis/type III secretory pathway ATPase